MWTNKFNRSVEIKKSSNVQVAQTMGTMGGPSMMSPVGGPLAGGVGSVVGGTGLVKSGSSSSGLSAAANAFIPRQVSH